VAVALWHSGQMGNHHRHRHPLQLPDNEHWDLVVQVQVRRWVGQAMAQQYLYGVR